MLQFLRNLSLEANIKKKFKAILYQLEKKMCEGDSADVEGFLSIGYADR